MSSDMGNARGGHEDDLDDGDHVDKEVEHVEFVSKVVPRSHAEKFDTLSAAWCESQRASVSDPARWKRCARADHLNNVRPREQIVHEVNVCREFLRLQRGGGNWCVRRPSTMDQRVNAPGPRAQRRGRVC